MNGIIFVSFGLRVHPMTTDQRILLISSQSHGTEDGKQYNVYVELHTVPSFEKLHLNT